MNIIIRNAKNQPIYEQIYEQMKTAVITGQLKEGELLPSIRNLAKDLRISVITTKRAYDELEREGYIDTVAGKGSYVARKNMEIVKETYLKEMEEHMQKIISLAEVCGVEREEVIEMFKLISEEDAK